MYVEDLFQQPLTPHLHNRELEKEERLYHANLNLREAELQYALSPTEENRQLVEDCKNYAENFDYGVLVLTDF